MKIPLKDKRNASRVNSNKVPSISLRENQLDKTSFIN